MAVDPELRREAERADARMLHELMCECAERAFARAGELGTEAPDESVSAVRAKRSWLAGRMEADALIPFRTRAVLALHPGHPLHLGATALAAIWMPRSGLSLPEDEAFAERITRAGDALEAALLGAESAVEAVVEATYRANKDVEAARAAERDERTWQRERLNRLLTESRPLLANDAGI